MDIRNFWHTLCTLLPKSSINQSVTNARLDKPYLQKSFASNKIVADNPLNSQTIDIKKYNFEL